MQPEPSIFKDMHTECIRRVCGGTMTMARVTLEPYANKILNVVKAKYELPDKSAALNKLIELYGHFELGEVYSDAYIKKVLAASREHHAKYPKRTMRKAELAKLFGK